MKFNNFSLKFVKLCISKVKVVKDEEGLQNDTISNGLAIRDNGCSLRNWNRILFHRFFL